MIITKYAPMNKGSLVAFFSVRGDVFEFSDCKYFQKGKSRWIQLPQRQFKKRDGSDAYADIVSFVSNEIKNKFNDQCLDAIDEYLKGSSR